MVSFVLVYTQSEIRTPLQQTLHYLMWLGACTCRYTLHVQNT